MLRIAMIATSIRPMAEPSHWDRLKQERVLLSIPEFCSVLGWHRSKYYRHKQSIQTVEGYGRPMIPVGEVSKILGEPPPQEPSSDELLKQADKLDAEAEIYHKHADELEAYVASRKEAGK